jgi:ATP-dependent helicase/nuclease subunit B
VFVPSHTLGRTLAERIALDGTNWLNLRFVTPLDIALRMGAPFLVERGIDPSEEGLGPALMMRLLLDLPLENGYFRPLADQPSMAQALWTTIRELRMAGIRSGDLKETAFTSPKKHVELRALLAAYEKFLVETRRGDMAVVYEEATKHPAWCPIQPEDCWTELPHVVWTPLQRALLDIVPGERITPRVLSLPGAPAPQRLEPRQVTSVAPDPQLAPLAYLMAPSQHPGPAPQPAIQLFHAGGREAEIEEVFRRILATEAPLDQVEIACASDAHLELVWEKALRHDWPVTLASGIPATRTRPGRALIGFCDWIETDFAAGHFRRLLQSGDMGVETDDEGFTAGQAARVLGRAGAGWGRETYGLALGRLHKAYLARAADPDQSADDRADAQAKAELTAVVLQWITRLVSSVPVPDANGRVSLQTVVDSTFEFIDHTTARKSALDHRAASALLEHVAELRALGAFSCALSEALRFIRERIELRVAPERPRPGHLYACSLSQACYSGRPHLFIVGLEEGRVFPAATEDPVLLDDERKAISPDLRQSTDNIDEAVHGALARLATWHAEPNATVTFSYSCRDTREFRETYASWLMLQAFRTQQRNAAASYPEMKAALGEAKSVVSADRSAAPSASGWWLRTIVGTADQGTAALSATFAGVARGRTAMDERSSDAFTEYDGFVPEAASLLDPSREGSSLSVTELQGVASCPFRFFLKRGLGVRPIDERDRDKDVWLDPLTRGSELHDLYALLLRRCRAENRRPDRDKDGPWLTALTRKRLADLQREMPAATPEILQRESEEFLADVDLFLEAECQGTSTRTPVAFEVSFGRPLDDADEPLARPEAVEIDLGHGLTFRIAGRIDRIDKVGPAAFEVIDYKTGSFWRDSWQGVFDGGRRLQHALYGLAAVELLRAQYNKPKVVAGVYYFPSGKGRRERFTIPAPSLDAIARVLSDLRELILAGAFVHTAKKDDCKFCDYTTACDQSLQGRAEQKLDDLKVQAYRRLSAHV